MRKATAVPLAIAGTLSVLTTGVRFSTASGQAQADKKTELISFTDPLARSYAVAHGRPCDTILTFQGLEPLVAAQTETPSPAKEPGLDGIAWSACTGGGQLASLIVTVPDPSNTHLGLFFDRTVESVQRAIEDSGYSFDRYWLPWEADEKEETDVNKRDLQRAQREARQKWPGVLLFRRTGEKKPPKSQEPSCKFLSGDLAVFLVAETPTSGVNMTAMKAAKGLGAALSGKEKKWPILIAGPTFSASANSIRTALGADAAGTTPVRILSGGATNPYIAERSFAGLSFHTLLHDDRAAVEQFYSHVNGEWGKSPKMAIISEDETGYGQQFAQLNLLGKDVLSIRFPRHIARLRNAYPESQEMKKESGSQIPQIRPVLPFQWKELATGKDSVPDFSAEQTPMSQEAVLINIARAVRRERYTFAAIVATDVMDALFIARYLRSACPDVRLFFFDADLLFARAAEVYPLTGSLAITTYPLFSRNQHWTELERKGILPRRVQFPSQSAQATYNACRALLLETYTSCGFSPKAEGLSDEEQLLEYSSPAVSCQANSDYPGCDRPPLWISVLSRTGYWPVALVETDSKSPEKQLLKWPQPKRDEKFRPEPPSRIWVFLLSALTLLLFGCATAVIGAHHRWRGLALLTALDTKPNEEGALGRAFFLFAASLAAIAAYITLASPGWVLGTSLGGFLGFAILSACATVYFLVAAIYLMVLASRRLALDTHRAPYLWQISFAGLCFFGFVGCGIFLAVGRPHHEGFFFAYRAIDPTNGVSPITPFLFVFCGIFWWAWTHIRRLYLQRERRMDPPQLSSDKDDPLARSICHLQRKTDDAVNVPFFRRWRSSGATAIVATALIVLRLYVQSFEHWVFDWLYVFCFGLLLALLFLTWSRMLIAWQRFRNYLEQLERHPVRYAFTDMRREEAWSPIMQRGIMERRRSTLTRLVEVVKAYSHGNSDPHFLSLRDQFVKAVRGLLTVAAHGLRVAPSDLENVTINRALLDLQQYFVTELERTKWIKGQSETFEGVKKRRAARDAFRVTRADAQSFKAQLVADEFIALQHLAYIRYILRQLRNMMIFVVAGFVFLVLSLGSYPFSSHHIMGWIMSGVFVVLGIGVGKVLAQLDRDALLSRITDTTAGKLGLDFYTRLLAYGALPLLTLLAAQFPSFGQLLFSWVHPALEAVK